MLKSDNTFTPDAPFCFFSFLLPVALVSSSDVNLRFHLTGNQTRLLFAAM